MKKRLLLGLLCITTLSEIMAQSPGDVITVETFNYSETGDPGIRDKVIEFPDNDVSYEKIIMLYNMRCKDGNVSPGVSGQTNIGCGEWDYSCNTYIIDSLRTDSISANHPTHTITGFSGNTFNYIETPVYNHYQYTMQEVLIDATLSETSSMISSGSDNINHLLSVTNESGKSQFLLSATELNDAGVTSGDLTGLKLDFQNGGSDANFLRIKMKSTTNSVLDASTLDTDGFTEVYFQNLSPAVGVEQFQFYTPFTWDGSSNIIGFSQTGNKFQFDSMQVNLSGASQGHSSRDTRTISAPLGLVVFAEVRIQLTCPTSANYGILVTDLANQSDSAVSLTNANTYIGGNGAYQQGDTFICKTNTSSQIGIRATGAGGTVNIATRGWTDPEI